MDQHHQVPTFYLYGKPHRVVGEGFIHVESLDDRSRPSDWTIAPHSHAELCHLFVISAGGGTMRADTASIEFVAPTLLVVPATTVHSFAWFDDSAGTVVTMADRYIRDLALHDDALQDVFAAPRALSMTADELETVHRRTAAIVQELGWSAPGHRAAVDASVLSLCVTILRKSIHIGPLASKPGVQATIVARLRERIEQRFRLREGTSSHAAALGLSATSLRVACQKLAGASPGQILNQRTLLEARRSLLFTNLSVAGIGYSLGFPDPAYFSRFFKRECGMSPIEYRARCGRDGSGDPGRAGDARDGFEQPDQLTALGRRERREDTRLVRLDTGATEVKLSAPAAVNSKHQRAAVELRGTRST